MGVDSYMSLPPQVTPVQMCEWCNVAGSRSAMPCSSFTSGCFPAPFCRCSLFCCLGAPTGKRFFARQTPHCIIRTSAQGFLPLLLRFSILLVDVDPGTRSVSHRLHSECLIAGDSLIWLFKDTPRRCDSRRRAMGACAMGKPWEAPCRADTPGSCVDWASSALSEFSRETAVSACFALGSSVAWCI